MKEMTIGKLVNLHKKGILKPKWEYQRGLVWSDEQMQLLIDSIFRGYQIPLIYLRKRQEGEGEYLNTYLDVIDGQQRINTIAGFSREVAIKQGSDGMQESKFKPLFDPTSPKGKKHFPISLQEQAVPWAGKLFRTLTDELRAQFLGTPVPVVHLECTGDEARHLFIRLQGGRALTPQEVRDAWPGDFCDLVLRIGGKSPAGKRGHDFFDKLTKTKSGSPESRQLVAQVLILYLNQRGQKSTDYFVTISSGALSDFYIENVSMGQQINDEVGRFEQILNKLVAIFGSRNPSFQRHFVIHLVLFTSILMDEYAPSWEKALAAAQDKFMQKLLRVKRDFKNKFPSDADQETQAIANYDSGTRQRSDTAEAIKERHKIYVRLMMSYMGDKLKPLDPKRAYTAEEREYIWRRDNKTCHVCEGAVDYNEAEIHHKVPHHQGGQTTLENGVLMHQVCHKEHHRRED